jgi:predicted metal-dependent phosphoesterase TrpH
VKLLKKA